MTPIEQYQQDIADKKILADPMQAKAVKSLQKVYDALQKPVLKKRWFRKPKLELVQGLYLWGPVGTGKTYLMDLFFHAIEVPKTRTHFHLFMKEVHESLKRLEGEKNPLDKVSDEIASKARVLCFDEFLVNDVVDAMVLANFLRGLFDRGITLMTTSNTEPNELYKHGLQRDAFLPAIALLKKNLAVLEVDNRKDYRSCKTVSQDGAYTSNSEALSPKMLEKFKSLAVGEVTDGGVIEVMGRHIEVVKRSAHAVWFGFEKICQVPRSQMDYLALVEQYKQIFVSAIPAIAKHQNDTARLFINFVDVLYNAQTQLFFSSVVPLEQIYTSGKLSFDFKRTLSRLHEMQSEDYLNA